MSAPRDPEELGTTTQPVDPVIADGTTVGAVHLTVGDLERSLDYYRDAIGLSVPSASDGGASLGAGGRELLVLVEEPGARPANGHTGLYHFALLVPERADLAALARARRARPRAADRPLRSLRQRGDLPPRPRPPRDRDLLRTGRASVWEGQVRERMTTLPLDVDEPPRRARRPRVGAVRRAAGRHRDGPRPPEGRRRSPRRSRFYRDVLGFGLMAQLGPRRRSSPPAATTTTSARTCGRARGASRRRPAAPRSATRRSCCPTPPSATASGGRLEDAGERRALATGRSCATRRATRSS